MKPEIVYGKIPVLECLRAGRRSAHTLFVQRDAKGLDEIRKAAAKVSVESVSKQDLEKLSQGGLHQGVVLHAGPLPVRSLGDWLAQSPPQDAIVVVLDGVEDPHNFGAIVRSAAAAGAAAVVFAKDRAAPLSPVAVKSAAGGMEHVALVRATNLVRAIEELKQNEFWIAALDGDADQTIWDANLTGRIALVIGSEGKGIRRLVLRNCDHHLRIPIQGPITSLNASVSAGIVLAECLRQRRA